MKTTPEPGSPEPGILLVSADVGLREQLYDLLARSGYAVTAAPSGEQAIDTLRHERPALILADAHLPPLNGMSLVEHIRTFDTRLPIILLNGNSPHIQTSMHLAKDAVAMQVSLPKPVDGAQLLKAIEPWLKPARARPGPRWPGTVLIVEDEPKLQQLLREFLQLHGFTAEAVSSGEEALRYLDAQTPPSVILLDVKMPGMDGLLTLKKIKVQRPATTVIIMTAMEDEQAARDAFALGAADFILKPFNLEYLETTLLSKLLVGETRAA